MAEDNIVSSKLGVMYGLDENINPLKTTNLLPCSSEREDNQNILFTNSHAVSMIQKLSEFKELSSKVSNKRKSINQLEKNFVEQSVSYQTSSNIVSSTTLSSKLCVAAASLLNDVHTYPDNSVSSDTFLQDDVGKESHISTSAENRKAELLHDNIPKQAFESHEKFKQPLISESVIENHSEAGPDVAEFSEEELRSVAELFKEPSAFDFFQKASNSKLLRESPLGRLSHFVKFDSFKNSEGNQEKSAQDSGLDISGDSNSLNAACGNDREDENPVTSIVMTTDSTTLASDDRIFIDMNSLSMKKMDKTSASHQQSTHCVQEHKHFTEEEFSQALKMQELLFHEKHVKRDKERCDQVKLLERDKQVLKNQIVALNKGYRASRGVLEELLNIFTLWLTAKEQERVEMTSSNQKVMKERDQALEDLQNVESAFADLHRRYENCKSVLEGYKQNEERMKQQVAEMQMKLKQQDQMYEMLRSRIQDKLDSANAEIESAKKSGDAEVTVLRAQLKKAEMKISSMEREIEQKEHFIQNYEANLAAMLRTSCIKERENHELSNICDDLIAKVSKT